MQFCAAQASALALKHLGPCFHEDVQARSDIKLNRRLKTLFNPLPSPPGQWSVAPREKLAWQCVLDTCNRTATGIPVYAVYWLVFCHTESLWTKAPWFAWINLVIAVFMGLVRVTLYLQIRKMLGYGAELANFCLSGAALLAGLHWGVVVAMCVEAHPVYSQTWLLEAITAALVVGGALTMGINPSLRFSYAVVVSLPMIVVAISRHSTHHLTLLTIVPMLALYLTRSSKVIQQDYWAGLIAQENSEKHAKAMDKVSVTDALTGILNRHGLDKAMSTMWAHARRHRTFVAVMMIDIDHFKVINDTYGQLVGDECIKATASILQQCMRDGDDVAGRFGGDEFVALLSSVDATGAVKIAERYLTQIRKARIERSQEQTLSFTCSLGIATVIGNQQMVITDLLRIADEALYEAKRRGRDQHVVIEQTFDECPLPKKLNALPKGASAP